MEFLAFNTMPSNVRKIPSVHFKWNVFQSLFGVKWQKKHRLNLNVVEKTLNYYYFYTLQVKLWAIFIQNLAGSNYDVECWWLLDFSIFAPNGMCNVFMFAGSGFEFELIVPSWTIQTTYNLLQNMIIKIDIQYIYKIQNRIETH